MLQHARRCVWSALSSSTPGACRWLSQLAAATAQQGTAHTATTDEPAPQPLNGTPAGAPCPPAAGAPSPPAAAEAPSPSAAGAPPPTSAGAPPLPAVSEPAAPAFAYTPDPDGPWKNLFTAQILAGTPSPGLEEYRLGEYRVLVASTRAAAATAMAAWHADKRDQVVGLDFEWTPEYAPGRDNPIALVQLSTHRTVVLLRTALFRHCLPPYVQQLLVDPTIQLAVCGWNGSDAWKYKQSFSGVGLNPPQIKAQLCEVQELARGAGMTKLGLRSMVQSLLHPSFHKVKKESCYPWAASRQLPIKQVRYAALDAICHEHVYRTLLTLPQLHPPTPAVAAGAVYRPSTPPLAASPAAARATLQSALPPLGVNTPRTTLGQLMAQPGGLLTPAAAAVSGRLLLHPPLKRKF